MPSAARIQQGLGSEQLRVNKKNEHLPTHDYDTGQSVIPEPHKQKMVSSQDQKPLPRTQKLQDRNRQWYYIQKDAKPPKTVSMQDR